MEDEQFHTKKIGKIGELIKTKVILLVVFLITPTRDNFRY